MNTPQPWDPLPIPPSLSKEKFYFGTSGYHFDYWVGKFNPPKHSPDPDARDRLRFYLRYFDFIEINQTFYRPIEAVWFGKFLNRCNDNTQITIKVHRGISHNWRWDLDVGKNLMDLHVSAVQEALRSNRLFSFLIQLEDRVTYSPRRLNYLICVSQIALNAGIDVHIEFRNITWHRFEILDALKNLNIGICNTEIPRVDRSIFPLKTYATSRKGYLRYSGRNTRHWRQVSPDALSRKEQIVSRNKRYNYLYSDFELHTRVAGQIALRGKTECVAVAFNNHYDAAAVENALTSMRLVDEILRHADPGEGQSL